MAKKTKRTRAGLIILTITLIAILSFCLFWVVNNFNTIKSTFDGTKLYTQQEVNDAYNKGLEDKSTFENQIVEWMNKYEEGEIAKSELQVQINEKQELINQKQEELELKQVELNNLQNSNETLQEELELKQSEVDALTNELDLLQADYEVLEEEYEVLDYNSAINSKLIKAINDSGKYLIAYQYNGNNFAIINQGETLSEVLPELGATYAGWKFKTSKTTYEYVFKESVDTYIPDKNMVLELYAQSGSTTIM
ncbi:MAG: hypothetical protein IJZ29_04315 [Clostridia bacterium]|nr:hypothetical protein [Clostridia bacterium]